MMEITAIIICLNHSSNPFVVKCYLDAANVYKLFPLAGPNRSLMHIHLLFPLQLIVLFQEPHMEQYLEVSRPEEPPLKSLSEPYVNLSAHTAPIIQPLAVSQISSVQTGSCHALLSPRASVPVAKFFILPKYSAYDFRDEIPNEVAGNRKILNYFHQRQQLIDIVNMS